LEDLDKDSRKIFNKILKQYAMMAYFSHKAQNRDQWKVPAKPAMKNLWYMDVGTLT